MANTNVPKISARFETTLASSMAKAATSFTLVSGNDKAGNALAGIYGFVIDNGTSTEEFVIGSISGTTVSSVASGLDPANPQTTVAALQQSHRKGASVKITDYPILAYLREMLNGNAAFTLDNKLLYTAHPSITGNQDIPDKQYVDGVALAGAPDASTSTKGVTKMSTAPVLSTNPIAVGDNDTRVPTAGQAAALPGDNADIAVGSGNKYATQTGLQKQAENYAADSGAADALVITLSPVPTSYAAGMIVRVKVGHNNLTTTPTINVNSLGAKTITKNATAALVANDLIATQLVTLVYDGTQFQLQNPPALTPPLGLYKNGVTTRALNAGSGAQTIAHGLGTTPKYIRIVVKWFTGAAFSASDGVYNGTTTSCVYVASGADAGNSTTNIVQIENGSSANMQQAIAAFDGTNITLTWTLTNGGSVNGTMQIMWEAFA